MEGCVICSQPCVKQYHCPRCAAPYCGVPCFRHHKEQCVEKSVRTVAPPATPYDTAIHRLESTAPTASPPVTDEGDDELEVLRSVHLSALATNRDIRDQLKSSELRKLIRIIDNSRSRLDALDAALHNVPEFKDFCDLVLQTVHGCNERVPP
jgi:hypothetical protein